MFDNSDGFFSGQGMCTNNPECSENKDEGPVPPGIYDMERTNKYGGSYWLKEGIYDRQICKLGFGRCEFFLHKGARSLGCITANKNNSDTMKQWENLMNVLDSETSNTMVVQP